MPKANTHFNEHVARCRIIQVYMFLMTNFLIVIAIEIKTKTVIPGGDQSTVKSLLKVNTLAQ